VPDGRLVEEVAAAERIHRPARVAIIADASAMR